MAIGGKLRIFKPFLKRRKECGSPCKLCSKECPIDAIISDTENGSERWLEVNKKYSEIWPNISEAKEPLPDHEKYKNEENKFDKYFEENI